jgi:hypothetical protein
MLEEYSKQVKILYIVTKARSKFFLVKLLRATGGCLGINRRRRTRKPAISSGELERSIDPEISEWGNPIELTLYYL